MIFLIFIILFVSNIMYLAICRFFIETIDGDNLDEGSSFSPGNTSALLSYIFGRKSLAVGSKLNGTLLGMRSVLLVNSLLFVLLLWLVLNQ